MPWTGEDGVYAGIISPRVNVFNSSLSYRKAHNHEVMGFLFLFIIMMASLDIGHPQYIYAIFFAISRPI